jgi:phosphoribosyl 1,2-cyclic phosphodiesterase
LKLCWLASGSRGNCLAVWAGDPPQGLLIDVGINYRQMRRRMDYAGIKASWFKAVLLTHCHGDHHDGIRIFTEHHGLPIYCTTETADRVEFVSDHPGIHVPIEMRAKWEIAGFEVSCLPVWHNAAGAVTYFLRELPDGPRLAMLFETGQITAEMIAASHGADVLAIESNFDPRMLADSDRPMSVIDRVAGNHLGNNKCQDYLRKICEDPPRLTVLLHLSSECNRPEIALKLARDVLPSGRLVAAMQDSPTEVFDVP